MAKFYFHLVSPGSYVMDDVGTELANAEAAYLDACKAVLEMSFEMLRERIDPSQHWIEITDAKGVVLFEVPFSEIMRPSHREKPRPDLHATLHQHHERADRIVSELKTGFLKTRSLLETTRALLTNAG